MGLKHYLNLFKDAKACEEVKLRYFFGMLAYIVLFFCLVVYFGARKTNLVVAAIAVGLGFVALAVAKILSKIFKKFVDKQIALEALNEQDEVDAAFIAYRKGYSDFKETIKILGYKLLIFDISYALMLIVIMVVPIVLDLLGKPILADRVQMVAIIALWVIIIINIIVGFALNKNLLWYQKYTNELAVINNYKAALSGGPVRFKITEDKSQQKQAEYILTDSSLRKRFTRVTKIFSFSLLGCVIAYIASMIIIFNTAGEDLAGKLVGIAFCTFVVVMVVGGIIVSQLQKKIIQTQLSLLKRDESKNALYIKLHELKTPFVKRWNILFVVLFAAAIISNIIINYVVSLAVDGFGWIFLLLFFVEIIALFIVYFKSYAKLRQQMIIIENQIDRIAYSIENV